MSSGEAGGARTLRLIGYWSGPGEEHWPDPTLFVDGGANPSRLRWVGEYLRSGTVFVAAAGTSPCRLCGIANGSTELTDGVHFVWPQGLAHYVEAHNVRLPDEITQLMVQPPTPVDVEAFERDIFETGNVVIDDGWWRSTYGSGS